MDAVALPRTPVLDWTSFARAATSCPPGVEQLPHRAFTTSGRAAIYQALRQLQLPPGSVVLMPTYHCPTMVAPVRCAGLTPRYFGLQDDGLPALEEIDAAARSRARALVAAHYFGIPRSFRALRAWCDRHGIALIEDCAHCLYGQAGERTVGHWGDFATVSLSKFLPVPEAGMLASAHRPIAGLSLAPRTLKAQVKGCVDVLEHAFEHDRLSGLKQLLGPALRLKNRAAPRPESDTETTEAPASLMETYDMGRIAKRPLAVSLLLLRTLPRQRIATRRSENFARYAALLSGMRGARPLFESMPEAAAPYVFPLWVDEPEPVYQASRRLRLPIFRWDWLWPGAQVPGRDAGRLWSRHVLQLLCHQDLAPADIEHIARTLIGLIRYHAPSTFFRPAIHA